MQVEELAKSCMPNPVTLTVGKKVGASTAIAQKLIYCGSEEGKVLAMRQLVAAGLRPPVLVFVQSVDRAKQLFLNLAVVDRRREFFRELGPLLETSGLSPVPGSPGSWQRPGWEDDAEPGS